jgi:urea carboxylase system permease
MEEGDVLSSTQSSSNEVDSRDLASLGYKQELHRSLGSFSSFAAGFSYISILTGMFQTSYLGFAFAGRAFVWTWPVVFLGQLMVAFQFAELAAHYPLAGSIYQWSKQMAGKAYAWNNGWVYLCAQIVTIPAVAVGWQVILPQVSTSFQFIKCSPVGSSTCPAASAPTYLDPAFAKNGLILGIVMIILTTAINMAGVRAMATINNIGVAAELIGASGLIILYLVHIQNSPSALFQTDGTANNPYVLGYFGALLLGAIMPLYVMYGFDTAGSLAEETSDPRKKAPKAVIQSLCTAGAMGFLLITFGILAVSPAGVKNLGSTGLQGITVDVLGETWGKVFLVDVAMAIFVCCLAIQAMSVRILFAMGRDNSLPAARALSTVHGKRRVPVVPALTSGGIAILILASNWANAKAFTIIISMGIIMMYIAYLMLNVKLYGKRNAGWPDYLPDRGDRLFRLGSMAKPTNILAIIYGASMIINLLWPRVVFYGPLWYQKWGPILITAFLIGAGLIIYYGYQKDRIGVLDEHRAAAVPAD